MNENFNFYRFREIQKRNEENRRGVVVSSLKIKLPGPLIPRNYKEVLVATWNCDQVLVATWNCDQVLVATWNCDRVWELQPGKSSG